MAIKIIHAKYANQPRFIRRFEAEAQIVARLEYPHIVPLYDYWREADGAYLVMRRLRGGSLQAALEKKLFGVETAVTLITQIAAALHNAHRQGIIHRDVKPANILLDEEGNAYLSDFGIARDTTTDLQLTQANELIGSPNYISPEQLFGEEVTPAADVYCLGLVLYNLLTGSQPYSTTSMAELMQKQINEPLPLIGAQRPELPTTIDDIIQQATAKKAKDRFSDTLALAEALRQAVRGQDGDTPTTLREITAVPEADIINPYKGLQAFQERDADYFYGRQTLIEQLLSQFSPSPFKGEVHGGGRFLTIVGPSGSGKSSVVKAGLIPALQKGALPGSEKWFIVDMTPGSYPLEELEAALLRVAVNPPPSL
ncbi:MAG: serine/threonine-protein kinase, partial [Anaerolineae bacterium]